MTRNYLFPSTLSTGRERKILAASTRQIMQPKFYFLQKRFLNRIWLSSGLLQIQPKASTVRKETHDKRRLAFILTVLRL